MISSHAISSQFAFKSGQLKLEEVIWKLAVLWVKSSWPHLFQLSLCLTLCDFEKNGFSKKEVGFLQHPIKVLRRSPWSFSDFWPSKCSNSISKCLNFSSGHLNVCASLGVAILNRFSDRIDVYFIVDAKWKAHLEKIDSRFKFGVFEYDQQDGDQRILEVVNKLEAALTYDS